MDRRTHERLTTLGLGVLLALIVALVSLALSAEVAYFFHKQYVTESQRISLINYDCNQAAFTYRLMNYLVADTSPRFGTKPGFPPFNNRANLILQLHQDELANVQHFKKQGCDLTKEFNPTTLGIVK